jgi:hypothetical protein
MRPSTVKRLEALESAQAGANGPDAIVLVFVPGTYEADDPRYSAKEEEASRRYFETGDPIHLPRHVTRFNAKGGRKSYSLAPGEVDPHKEPANA